MGRGVVEPVECKVTAVKNYQQTYTKKQVRSFLGLCRYYQKFIPNFFTIAHPLTELTRKNSSNKDIWNTDCKQAFNKLKEELTKSPVLMTPDWTKEFTIETDASATGLGFVLMQKNNEGLDHPVAYGSRKLLPRERNYSTIEREALAIVTGIKHFRTYVEGTKFIVGTDHDPLTHLATLKDSHGRLARWALTLQPYQFQVRHRRGSANANADGLSRDPYPYSRTEVEGVSENSLPESLTASCCGAAGLPARDGLPEWSLADIVGAGDRPQSLRAAAGRDDWHVKHKQVETPDWSPRSSDDVS